MSLYLFIIIPIKLKIYSKIELLPLKKHDTLLDVDLTLVEFRLARIKSWQSECKRMVLQLCYLLAWVVN